MTGCILMLCSCGGAGRHNDVSEEAEHHHGHDHEHGEDVIHLSEIQAKAAGLQTETAAPADFAEALRVSGQVVMAQGDEAVIVARSTGTVSFVRDHLTEGAAITSGERFATISADGMAGGDQMRAYAIDLEAKKTAYERAGRLFADTIISQSEYLAARQAYELALTAMGSRGATTTGSGTAVTSPITGFVRSIHVRQGEYVTTGQPIATLTRSCRLQLRAEIPEKYFSDIHNIRSANFEMSYGGGVQSIDSLHGHIVAAGKVASEGSAYIPLTFEFEDRGNIVPGAFADIWLLFAPRHGVLSVPTSAITEEQGVYYLYVQLDDPDEFVKREVRTGMTDGIRTEILSGISKGDRVVTKGAYQVKLASAAAAPEAHSHNH